jgi:glycosyltransferase involved in cell wall biosynthesis
MSQTPILFISDTLSAPTGLARIARDLALRLAKNRHFKVAALGHQPVVQSLPVHQYTWQFTGTMEIPELPDVWRDFAGDRNGIVFPIMDASRLLWMSRPEYGSDDSLKRFIASGKVRRTLYTPFDSTGPGDRLTSIVKETLLGFERLLVYTEWADGLVKRTLGEDESAKRGLTWLPHGIDMEVFRPRDKATARKFLNPKLTESDFVIGVVATNQRRKDWGLVMETVALVKQKIPDVKLWIHTDVMVREWSLPALIDDFGLKDNVFASQPMTDEGLSYGYSACDVTMAPGSEGFGYPIAESMACGTPCVHMAYAGGQELVPDLLQIAPAAFRFESPFNCVRPVFDVQDWSYLILNLQKTPIPPDECRSFVSRLDWRDLWPKWQQYFESLLETK